MKLIISDKIVDILGEGGKSRGKDNKQYDEEQLLLGKDIEQEHVAYNPNLTQEEKDEIAEKITRDHLEEAGDVKSNEGTDKGAKYYDLLEDMEKKINKRLGKSKENQKD